MAAPNGDLKNANKKIRILEDELEALQKKVNELLAVNDRQIRRLTDQELMKTRIRELEGQLNRDK